MTTLGHPEDFKVESFQRMVINGIHWAAGMPVPSTLARRDRYRCEVSRHQEEVKDRWSRNFTDGE